MPTECRRDLFGFAPVEGRQVVAGFDGGAVTSEAGAPTRPLIVVEALVDRDGVDRYVRVLAPEPVDAFGSGGGRFDLLRPVLSRSL